VKLPRNNGGLGQMRIPIVSDYTKSIASNYGVLIESGVSLRGLFIIDPQGIVRQVTINDLAVGRSVDETLRLVQAFQFSAEHGETCPANWRPKPKTSVQETNSKKDVPTETKTETNSIIPSVNEVSELNGLLNTEKVVVIDFFAPWCMNCKKVTPVIERLAAEFVDTVQFIKVDNDAATEISDEYNVSVLPTIVILRNKTIIQKYTGSDVTKIEELLRSTAQSN
jgi:thioredoxin